MEKRYIEKREMYLAVKDYITDASADVLGQMPGFDLAFGRFKAALVALDKASVQQSANRKGFREVKDARRVAMVSAAIDVSLRVEAYAVNTKNVLLATEMHFRYSDLFKKRDGLCADLCGFIYKKANGLLGDLGSYGITAGVLADLNSKVVAFIGSMPKPRMGIIERKEATRLIGLTIGKIDEEVAVMDTLVRMLQRSEPEFFSSYFSARRIIRRGHRRLAIEGFVVDEFDAPVSNVRVTVIGTKVRRRTSALGSFWVKNLKKGIYIVSFERVGFETERVSVAITQGIRSEVRVVLRRTMFKNGEL